MQAPAPDAAPLSTAATIPTLTVPFNLTDLSVDQFTTDLKQQFANAIQATLPDNANVEVYLLNIRAGSVLLDTYVEFLDGNATLASSLASAASNAVAVSPYLVYLHALASICRKSPCSPTVLEDAFDLLANMSHMWDSPECIATLRQRYTGDVIDSILAIDNVNED